MPVPLRRIRKRASNVNRSCAQILNETSSQDDKLPSACRFYNVGGIYNIGAKSRFVRKAIKKRTQLCCNCEGKHLSGDIERRRTSKGPCNPRSNNLEEYIASNRGDSTADDEGTQQ